MIDPMTAAQARERVFEAAMLAEVARIYAFENPADPAGAYRYDYRMAEFDRALVQYLAAIRDSPGVLQLISSKSDIGTEDNVEKVLDAVIFILTEIASP